MSGQSDVNIGEGERLASLLGGGALAVFGLTRRSPAGAVLALAGGYLFYRGAVGHCRLYEALGVNATSSTQPGGALNPLAGSVKVERSITINRPRAEVYRFWRQFENLPRFMQHLAAVTTVDERRSHWVARAPLGASAEWDAEVADEREHELIAWRSLAGSPVTTSGSVRFADAPGGRGTEVKVALEYSPPGGLVGAAVAKLFGEEPTRQVHDDLRRLKQLLETGELASTDGQPSGRAKGGGVVQTALEAATAGARALTGQPAGGEQAPAMPPVAESGMDEAPRAGL